MALFANVLIPGRKLATYNLHCESRGGDDIRYSQLYEFLRHANEFGLDVPVLAAGDFNFDLSRSRAAPTLEEMGFLNPFVALHQTTTISYSLSARDRIIDCILFRGPLKAADPKIHNSVAASDHYPLSLTVSFL